MLQNLLLHFLDSSISKLSQICRKKAVTNEDETNDNVFSQCFEDTSSYDATSDNRLGKSYLIWNFDSRQRDFCMISKILKYLKSKI